jgi:hypothetical protein
MGTTNSLQASRLEAGAYQTAGAIEPKVAATEQAFALFCPGGDRVVTWGYPPHGGDSSKVQSQLKGVQQVKATSSAFAAVLADGSVVTWGYPPHGGDISAVAAQFAHV